MALLEDITQRKQAEERLQEAERRFRELAEKINEGFWLVDPNQREILYVSPAYEQVWGRATTLRKTRQADSVDAVRYRDARNIRD